MLKNSEYLNCYDKFDYYNYIDNITNITNKTGSNESYTNDDEFNKLINNSVCEKDCSDDNNYKY